MSLTLLQARTSLARDIENGLCPDDSRVADRINEAVARLNALGDWVGSIARYAVTVDPATRSFTIPTALQSVIRAAVCPASVSHSTGGTLISDNEFAFVLESSPILSLQQLSPLTFRIVGPVIPEAVDVVGNLKLTEASEDSDPLAVDDIPALRLMVLALFRERSNQLEQAQALIAQASSDIRSYFASDILPGGKNFVSEEVYATARDTVLPALRRLFQEYFARQDVAAIVFPATMVPAPRIGDEEMLTVNGRKVPFSTAIARNIDPGSTAGLPGLVLPGGLSRGGLPVSLEFDGPAGSDRRLLALGVALEHVLGPLPAPKI